MKRPLVLRPRVAPIIPGKDLLRDMDKTLRLLGEVVNSWAGIEDQLCLVFSQLSGTDYDTATVVFYTPSSFRGRLQIIQNLVTHVMPDCPEKTLLFNALNKLNSLNKTRNTLVHARYGMASVSFASGKQDGWLTRGNVRPGRTELRTSVKAHIGEINDHLDALAELLQFFYFFTHDNSGPQCPIRNWAAIASIIPKAT